MTDSRVQVPTAVKHSTGVRLALLRIGLPALAALAAMGLFLLASARTGYLGFPLDDAWIHQTYARNLALRGEWAYLPGVPSAGSTAPLWSLLLAAGYRLFAQPYAWPLFLGLVGLVAAAMFAQSLFRSEMQSWQSDIPWLGLFLVGEWHLVWAAVSGMETSLYAALILAVFWLLARRPEGAWVAGALAGLAAWIRPDGLTLIGPVLFVIVLRGRSWRSGLKQALPAVSAFTVVVALYLLFNRLAAGSWLPNTFYAKQAEYAVYQQIPLLRRFISLAGLPLIGAGALVFPGAIFAAWKSARERRWVLLSMLIWWLGYTLIYALRLPVTYQHGRYLMPAMPVYFTLGAVGTAWMLAEIRLLKRVGFVLRRVWLLSILLVWTGFLLVGAQGYAADVAIITTEMVQTANWINQNTPTDAVIAAHDIGAIGYFGQRNLVDLAGLVSPEVIPFIRDEARLAHYLDERGVDYLVTFPGWYPELVQQAEPIYTTHATFSPRAGGENMTIYRWLGRAGAAAQHFNLP